MKEDIKSLTYPALCLRFGDLGLKRFRADQVYAWLHKVGVQDFEEMTNLSKDLRSKLDERFTIPACRIEEKYVVCCGRYGEISVSFERWRVCGVRGDAL